MTEVTTLAFASSKDAIAGSIGIPAANVEYRVSRGNLRQKSDL